MVRRMLRSSLWLSVVALGLCAQSLHAQSSLATNGVAVKTYTGFFGNTAVYFTAFETNSANFAAANGLVYAPKLSFANSAGVANLILVSNGAAGQAAVLQTEPGQSDYTPIWHVLSAQWRGAGGAPLITSYSAAIQLWQQGLLALQGTGILFNGPVVWIDVSSKSAGRLAPTISPNDFAGINPAARTVFLVPHTGYYLGQQVSFLSLEHAQGQIQNAPGAIPVPRIGVNFLGRGATGNFFAIQGQPPVIDSAPFTTPTVTPITTTPVTTTPITTTPVTTTPTTGTTYGIASIQGKPVSPISGQKPVAGVSGQTPVAGVSGQTPVAGVSGQTPVSGVSGQTPVSGVSGQTPVSGVSGQKPVAGVSGGNPNYSPIWYVYQVVFTKKSLQPVLLRSVADIQAALNAGLIQVFAGGAQDTFNCPVVTAGTSVGGVSGGQKPVGGVSGQTPQTSVGGVSGQKPVSPISGQTPTTTSPITGGTGGYVPPVTTMPTTGGTGTY